MKIFRAEVGMLATNCYFAVNEQLGEGVIIDPGADCTSILAMAKEANAKITAILLTHGHSDHIGALNELRKATGAQVYISAADAPCLEKSDANLSFFVGKDIQCQPADQFVKDGEILNLANMEFQVLATPGHTKGGTCYYNAENKVAFVGDTIFCESIGRTDLPGGSYKELLQSIKAKLLVLPDEVHLLPGHGPGTTVGWERRRNPFLQ